MALVLKDRVKETTDVVGTGDASLMGAPATYQAFSTAVANASTVWYTIAAQTGTQWEVGYGTFNASSNAIVRNGAQIYASSSSGSIRLALIIWKTCGLIIKRRIGFSGALSSVSGFSRTNPWKM